MVVLGVDRDHRVKVIDHEESADDLRDVKQRVLCQLAGGVELAVLGILLLLGELCILGFELVPSCLTLFELGTA